MSGSAAVMATLAAAVLGTLTGAWQPTSRALEPLGPLRLETGTLEWSICRGAVPRALPEAGSYAIDGSPGCVLDGQPLSHLRLTPRPGGCRAELSLFSSADALRANAPVAWGLVQRAGCR